MITGIAVLGVLAGSLAQLFNIGPEREPDRAEDAPAAESGGASPLSAELAMLQAQLRLGEVAAKVSARSGGDC